MIVIPVPEFGAGVLEPGSNLAAWIDNKIIPFHMYQGTWDPEGLLSTIPAVVTGISGMIAGHLIVSNKNINEKIILLFVGGAFRHNCWRSLEVGLSPINKNLWTSSYVLYTSGLASIAWAILIWVMDIKKYINWGKPAIVFGSNAIIAYILLYIIGIPLTYIPISGNHGIQELYMESLINIGLLPELISLSWAVIYTALCYIPVLYISTKKEYFLKI